MATSINQSPILIEQALSQAYSHAPDLPSSPSILPTDAPGEPSYLNTTFNSNPISHEVPPTMDNPTESAPPVSAASNEQVQNQPAVTMDELELPSEGRDQDTSGAHTVALSQIAIGTDPAQPGIEATTAEPTAEPTVEVSTAVDEHETDSGSSLNPPNTDGPSETTPAPESEREDKTCDDEDEIPEWVKYEEDTSIPDEEEMKEIEGSEYDKVSAIDVKAVEEQFFLETEDPEQRPLKKLRLSWTIKGVRGTKERPNYARVMNSPGAFVDGLYWSIKFYPRGDNCNSLSAFVRCSQEPPPVDEECPESEFSFYQGTPETDLSANIGPEMKITIPAKDRPKPIDQLAKTEKPEVEGSKKQVEVVESEDLVHESHTASKKIGSPAVVEADAKDTQKWRVSAQLGMVIYNPAEPRTGHLQSDGHQFSRFCDDWGWVSFVGPWDEIHRRKRGQRQALLRNDTLSIDAYIQIYDDPTEALWWHESKDESQWPSKELAGYFSMGTPGLYHSPAVAGITAWFLMAPFRSILQDVDGGKWRCDSRVDPKPLICQSQLVLDQMRTLSTDCYVNLYKIIEELIEVDEKWQDVATFWEAFRRGLELELVDDVVALQKMSSIFDAAGKRWNAPSLPVPGSTSIQEGLATYLEGKEYRGALPNFLPIVLNRSDFDNKKREWKLHHDRVRLDDELELSKWCSDPDSKFTLYGFVAHVGPRNSGKFYSVLRPGGVGTKWLAFEDGNGNKVFSYSKKRIQEFEGLDYEELRTFPASQVRENAYMAMYIRNSCVTSYLTGSLEPYKLPRWLKPFSEDSRDCGNSQAPGEETSADFATPKPEEDALQIELYLDEFVEGAINMLGIHDLRTSPIAQTMCRTVKVAKDTTFRRLRMAIARAFEVNDPCKVVMLEIQYQSLGKYSRAILEPFAYQRKIIKETVPGEPFRIWLAVQQPIGEKLSYQHLLDCLENLDLRKKLPEQNKPSEDTSLEDIDIERLTAMIDAEHENQLPSDTDNEINSSDTAVADEEQASVTAAVATDLDNATNNQSQIALDANRTFIATSAEGSQDLRNGERVETHVSDTPTISPNSAIDPDNSVANNADASTLEADGAELALAVVHGHLVDAVQHAEPTSGVVITHSSAHIPHGDVDALAQVLAEVSPSSDDPSRREVTSEPTQTTTINSREIMATIPVPRAYGNVQLFNADQQIFSAQRPFHPELDAEIGKAVRKHLGYEESRQIRIWKRQGVAGTESVNASATFASAGLQDVFTFIVGDVLSEEKCEELKAAGKFGQPQQLIAYLGMLKRKHPHATITSSDPVEIADYGNDYYKGPLCRGRPHGENGLLITSTGHTYVGPFVAGQKSGPNGKMTYQNGDTYVGDWLNDERHGQGEHKELRTGNRYVGGFENGKRWGQGVTYWQVADQQADMCQICYEEEIDALFFDCGHVCACVACAKQCDTCPLCRRSVAQVVKMYRA